jgi:hypothetical protein
MKKPMKVAAKKTVTNRVMKMAAKGKSGMKKMSKSSCA